MQQGEDEIRRFYAEALEGAASVANRSVSSGFEEGRKKTWAEFNEFCGLVGKSLEQATDLDVVAFVHGFWLPHHREGCRTKVGESGVKTASASAIKGVFCHLGKSFAMLGRNGESNPTQSEAVRNYMEGYRNLLHDAGVREKRASTFKESKVQDLIAWLENKVQSAEGTVKCSLLSDLAIVHYLWESWSRGQECGTLEMRQVDFSEGIVKAGWRQDRS